MSTVHQPERGHKAARFNGRGLSYPGLPFLRAISDAVAAGELTGAQGTVLRVLGTRGYYQADEEGVFSVSQPTLAAEAGYSRTTVWRALREIRGTWVEWGHQEGRPNRYQLLWPRWSS